jgi:hypothetical protein
MRKKFLKGMQLLCAVLLLFGCDLLTGTDQPDIGDWDWAEKIADDLVEETYGGAPVKHEFEANYLNADGRLYGGVQHPLWHVVYKNMDIVYSPEVHVIVHPDGSTTTFTDSGWGEYREIDYSSGDVCDWLWLAISCYRYVTGRQDDVCYGLHCYSTINGGDFATVTLYDSDIEELAWVRIDIEGGIIDRFELPGY